mmetsp:Transcript_175957/g.564209  ORF Transcript_175957/g.564209 Transcript_175957/m.564209 type:complete len:533 (+) Transcript_175957:65-1663(+)
MQGGHGGGAGGGRGEGGLNLSWASLQQLIDHLEHSTVVVSSLDAHLLENDALRGLSSLGADVLRTAVTAELRATNAATRLAWGPAGLGEELGWIRACAAIPPELSEHGAWLMIKDEPLAHLFDALGLDARMRRHRRQLSVDARASVVRAMAGEVDRHRQVVVSRALQGRSFGATLRKSCIGLPHAEFQRQLAAALIEVYLEHRPRVPAKRMSVGVDPRLCTLLLSGSARAILERILELHRSGDAWNRDQIWCALVTLLPSLNIMRLLVFVQVLEALCTADAGPMADHPAERAGLVCAIVNAVAAAGLTHLPLEGAEQAAALQNSPFLGAAEQRHMQRLLLPEATPAAPCFQARGRRGVAGGSGFAGGCMPSELGSPAASERSRSSFGGSVGGAGRASSVPAGQGRLPRNPAAAQAAAGGRPQGGGAGSTGRPHGWAAGSGPLPRATHCAPPPQPPSPPPIPPRPGASIRVASPRSTPRFAGGDEEEELFWRMACAETADGDESYRIRLAQTAMRFGRIVAAYEEMQQDGHQG